MILANESKLKEIEVNLQIMNTTELIKEIELLRYVVILLSLLCLKLYLSLKKHSKESDLWQHQFYALKNTFLKLTKTWKE